MKGQFRSLLCFNFKVINTTPLRICEIFHKADAAFGLRKHSKV